MADNKEDVLKGNENNSPEQEKRRKNPNKDLDPQREVDGNKNRPAEKNPDDF